MFTLVEEVLNAERIEAILLKEIKHKCVSIAILRKIYMYIFPSFFPVERKQTHFMKIRVGGHCLINKQKNERMMMTFHNINDANSQDGNNVTDHHNTCTYYT